MNSAAAPPELHLPDLPEVEVSLGVVPVRRPRRGLRVRSRELLGAFHRWQPRDTVEWFEARGVSLKTESDGRMFPMTDNSETIVHCLQDLEKIANTALRQRGHVSRYPTFWVVTHGR